jgi:hypothetical protein
LGLGVDNPCRIIFWVCRWTSALRGLTTGIFRILDSSATQWYQDAAPTQELFFHRHIYSLWYGLRFIESVNYLPSSKELSADQYLYSVNHKFTKRVCEVVLLLLIMIVSILWRIFCLWWLETFDGILVPSSVWEGRLMSVSWVVVVPREFDKRLVACSLSFSYCTFLFTAGGSTNQSITHVDFACSRFRESTCVWTYLAYQKKTEAFCGKW